jgi:hypothetical protein
MICPACKNPMIVVEYQKTELDFCANCHGVWFDAGELELLLEKTGSGGEITYLHSLLQSKEATTTEKKRRCPICRRNMKKVNAGNGRGVLIDACGRGDGIWFDGGEVDQVVLILAERSHPGAGHGHVFSFMKEVLKAHHV